MGRKSLANERTEQILDAFERCIVKYGYESSSLELIAKEANVKRSIIRHYIGNREDLSEALIDRILSYEANMTQEALQRLSPKQLKKELLNYLFLTPYDPQSRHIELLLKALWQSAESNPRINKMLAKLYKQSELEITESLQYIYPKAKSKQLKDVAYSLLCLAEGLDNTQMIGFDKKRAKSIRQTAEQIINTIES